MFKRQDTITSEWAALLRADRDVNERLGKLSNIVARDHPLGWAAVHARFETERRAAGNDLPAKEAMLERWLILTEETAAEIERKRQAHFDANLAAQVAERRRAFIDDWRGRLPVHATIATLRAELDDIDRLADVFDDVTLQAYLDRFAAALATATADTSKDRKATAARVRAAQAEAVVEAHAPVAA